MTLTVIVRAEVDAPRNMVATDSAMRSTWRSSSPASTRSWLKVSSWPIDLFGRFGLTGSGSSPRARAARWAPLALPRRRTSVSSGQRGQVAHGAHAEAVQALRRGGPHAPERLDVVGVEELELGRRFDEDDAGPGLQTGPARPGLGGAGGELGDHLGAPDPHRAAEAELVAHAAPQVLRDAAGVPEEPHRAGHVHEGLVEPDRLHDRGHVVEDRTAAGR